MDLKTKINRIALPYTALYIAFMLFAYFKGMLPGNSYFLAWFGWYAFTLLAMFVSHWLTTQMEKLHK